MQFETRFGPQDTVWTVEEEWLNQPCPACEATGNVNLHGVDYHCPKCQGIKSDFGSTGRFLVEEHFIAKIVVSKAGIVYHFVDGFDDYPEAAPFATEAEAQAEADRRNKQGG